MKHRILNALPNSANYHPETGPMKALNYSSLQNPSISGSTSFGKGAVVFRLSNFRDPVRISIDLNQNGHGNTMDSVDFQVPAKNGNVFVVFEGFPTTYSRLNTRCEYDLWLLNMTPNKFEDSTSVDVQVFYLA